MEAFKKRNIILFLAVLGLQISQAQVSRFGKYDTTSTFIFSELPLRVSVGAGFAYRPGGQNIFLPPEIINSVSQNMREGAWYGGSLSYDLNRDLSIGLLAQQGYYRSRADVVLNFTDGSSVNGFLDNQLKLSFLGIGVHFRQPFRQRKDYLGLSVSPGLAFYDEEVFLINSRLTYRGLAYGLNGSVGYSLQLHPQLFFNVNASYLYAFADEMDLDYGLVQIQVQDPGNPFDLQQVLLGAGLTVIMK